jgi:hypothetical protein
MMHPEIVSFWETHYGSSVIKDEASDYFYVIMEDGGIKMLAASHDVVRRLLGVAHLSTITSELVYFYKGLKSEEEMLRLVHLKAFL